MLVKSASADIFVGSVPYEMAVAGSVNPFQKPPLRSRRPFLEVWTRSSFSALAQRLIEREVLAPRGIITLLGSYLQAFLIGRNDLDGTETAVFGDIC